ncbi:MAG: RHS repeat domain-containing protein, partial [Bacteroidota bacterium]
ITFNNFGRKINETQINDANQTLVQSYIYETGSRPRHLLKRINKFQLQGSTSSRFTEFNYDDINRLTQTNDEGRITNIQYIRDAGGYHEKTTNINSSNNLLNGVYWVFYNKDGTIKEVNDRGVSVIYSYDEFGNISQINADGAITLITSDAYGRRHTLKDANTGIYTYEYFANGLLRKQIDPQANATEIKYDQLGRTTEQKRINGTATETTTYSYVASGNGKGQLQTISNGITSENYAYDALGRILSITENIKSQNFTTCYEYNSLGRQSKLSYPGGFAILKNYTESGLLASITDAATNNLLWQAAARDVFDRCTQINYAGGLQLINEYKANHTLQRSGISKNGNYIARMEYDINFENGNLNLRKDLVRNLTETFEYDINDRLKKIYLNSVLQYEMQYAPNGNILRKPDIHDPVNGSYQYNANAPHAVTTITNTTINIPAFTGNQQVMMNMAQRAATITKNIGNNTTLKVDITYGPDDERRYAKTEHSLLNNGSSTPTTQSETYYLGNYERIIANGQTKEIYYIGAENGLFAVMIRTGNTQQLYYTFTDNLGSVLELIQPSGVIAESYSFDAWGRRRNTANWSYANITNPTILTRGFTGHEHLDEFGLINMNARLYDPYIARMLGPDKYVQDPANAQNYNRYSYCWNNPLKYTDPDGNLVFGLPLLFWGIAAYTATSSAMIMTGHRPSQTFTVAATVAITVATAGITSSIAASGFLGNTSAIIFGSMVSSSTSFMTSGGKSDLSVSFGVASYSFSRNEFGHLGNDGNSRWENVGYGLGVLANLADVNQLINSTDATLYTQKRYEDGSKDYISHTGIVDDATGEKLMSFGPNSEGFIDGKVGFAIEPKLSTTNYPVPINLSKSVSLAVNKHSFILTRALGKILPYQGLTINCVNMSSLSLWLNGIPNIGIHPALLHFSIQAYKSGLRPDLFSYYLQKR